MNTRTADLVLGTGLFMAVAALIFTWAIIVGQMMPEKPPPAAPYDYLKQRVWCIECDTYDTNEATVILQGK